MVHVSLHVIVFSESHKLIHETYKKKKTDFPLKAPFPKNWQKVEEESNQPLDNYQFSYMCIKWKLKIYTLNPIRLKETNALFIFTSYKLTLYTKSSITNFPINQMKCERCSEKRRKRVHVTWCLDGWMNKAFRTVCSVVCFCYINRNWTRKYVGNNQTINLTE